MKRARPKGKAKAMRRIKEDGIAEREPQIAEETAYDTISEKSEPYDSIIDEIQREKKKDTVSRPQKVKKAKKQHSPMKVILTLLAVLVAFIVIAMGTNLFDDDDILAPLEDGKINVLLAGVDEDGLRTDAIMVASYDVNDGKIYLTNKKATRKINAVHALVSEDDKKKILGVQATAEAVTQLTGIPINYYVEFSFLSIDHLFDTLGGVVYDVPDVEGKGRGMNYDDPYQNLHIHLKPGVQTLTGNQVQQFLRYRKSNYRVGTGSDTDRVKRQQEFIKAVVDQKLNMTIIPKIPGIFSQLSKEIKTNISKSDITKYIRHFKKLSAENIRSFSLAGENKIVGGASYFVCDLAATKALISENFEIDGEVSDQITLSGKNPQTPLRAGNMTKPAEAPQETINTPQETPVNEEKEPEKKEEPKKEEKEEKPEKKEDVPEIPQNDTPLEDIYNLDD